MAEVGGVLGIGVADAVVPRDKVVATRAVVVIIDLDIKADGHVRRRGDV